VILHGGIVLAGGRSSRMGRPKELLEWRGVPLLAHVVDVIAAGTGGPVVVVRAVGQLLPPLPGDVEIVEDELPGQGVLAGIARGLRHLAGSVEVAYASAVDMPLLQPAFVKRVCAAVTGDIEIALPSARGHVQPLAAAYRTSLSPLATRLVCENALRPADLFAVARTLLLDEVALLADAQLRRCDPDLESLVNVNDPGEWERIGG
jgi:molybdenum cofactor guanylyltransferase